MGIIKIASKVILGVVSVLIVTLIVNTVIVRQRKFSWDAVERNDNDKWILDSDRSLLRAQRLAKALTIPTVSWEPGRQESKEFLNLHAHIKESFPLIHSSPIVELTVINKYSLLYKVKGSQPNNSLPYMLAAHLDVVPVDGKWIFKPFGGEIINNTIYGRGAIDDKNAVMAILEAVEFLIEQKFDFKRTFYMAFGHDEELAGHEGAEEIAKHLQENGVDRLDFILDEGSFVLEDIVQGINRPVSMIAVTEKGSTTLDLQVDATPGHSSLPPRESAIGILARAVANLEETRQPSMFGNGPETDFFLYLSTATGFGRAMIFANLWLFSPVIKYVLSLTPITDSVQRTTTAVTIFNGGYKANVVPGSASAVVNHRIYPSEDLEKVLAYDRKVINDDRVKVSVKFYYPPTPISPYGPDIEAFDLIARSIKYVYPESVVAPGTSPANTDLRRYVELSDKLYRISPIVVTPITRAGLHGDDERITVLEYHHSIEVFVRVIVNADEAAVSKKANRFHREL